MSSEDNNNKSVTSNGDDNNNNGDKNNNNGDDNNNNGDKNKNKKTVTLKTSNGKTFEVEVSIISQSQTIKHMIEDDCADEFIPVPNVEGKVMAKVIEYFKKHYKSADDADGVVDVKTKKEIHEWDIEFVSNMDDNSLFALILAANYLESKSLLDLVAQKIADDIKDKPVPEVRTLFGIESDFAPGEEEELKKQLGEIP